MARCAQHGRFDDFQPCSWHDVALEPGAGYSGAKDSQPAWNECWDAIQKGRVNVLLVHALDRLGKSLPHLVKIMSTLTERKIVLVSHRENIDLSTATGRMLAGFSLCWQTTNCA